MFKDGDGNPTTTQENNTKPDESSKKNEILKEKYKAMFGDRMNKYGSTSTFKGQHNPFMLDLSSSDDPKLQEMMRKASAGDINFMDSNNNRNHEDDGEYNDDDDDDDDDEGIFSPSYKPEHRLQRDIFKGKFPGSTEDQGYFSDFDSGFKNFKFMSATDILREKPLEVVSRKEWGALPPSKPIRPIKYPIKYVIVSVKSESDYCFSKEECMWQMREMQKRHMQINGLSDHPYNFMVGYQGTIYEGRGWNAKPSSYIKSHPDIMENRLDIAFFGDYQRVADPMLGSTTITDLLKYGVDNCMVDRFYDIMQYYEDELPL